MQYLPDNLWYEASSLTQFNFVKHALSISFKKQISTAFPHTYLQKDGNYNLLLICYLSFWNCSYFPKVH